MAATGSVPGVSGSILPPSESRSECHASQDPDPVCHEPHQHPVQLLSLPVFGGQEKREHRYVSPVKHQSIQSLVT